MKPESATYRLLVGNRTSLRNIAFLSRFLALLITLVLIYSILFGYFMRLEGQDADFITGLYWTLVTMSTLGYGDFTLSSTGGMVFSIIVLLTGTTFMLALFPFLFIQFFYTPWLEAQQATRSPRRAPPSMRGHIVLTHDSEVSLALIEKLERYRYPYVLLAPTAEQTLHLRDRGLNAIFGEADNPETYRNIAVDKAAMVVATGKDEVNANIAFTVREFMPEGPLAATANFDESVDLLEMAGCSHVIQLGELMGQALARRTLAGDAMAHIIGRFDQLLIAEATPHNTPLVGKTIQESRLREMISVSVVGLWDRGKFQQPLPDTVITPGSVLVLAGGKEHLHAYNELFCIYNTNSSPVVIIGGGRVGRATAKALNKRGIESRIIERDPSRIRNQETYVAGNAANLDVLTAAGIKNAPTVIITSHDDDTNIYLTIYCRRLRPDIQIISRAILDRNVSTLHRAGADIVMSYATMGANILFNILKKNDNVLLAEGMDFFRLKIPAALAGKTLAEVDLRQKTGCTVIAVIVNGQSRITPNPHDPLPATGELILAGNEIAEKRFLREYGT
ncbi:MAG TPA: NAD-binding protein [Kiritimatiellia bacterium]|nr:NAD-binding protein [Kiritimatiellia bacterium]HMO99559.1 NAD-binding protein [Kiritimatiellia bacterium]HMP97447.1 NAD-binding protein [Kiritimatiellia bacterium]